MTKKSIIIGTLILTVVVMFGFISKKFRGDKSETPTDKQSNLVLGMALLNDIPKIDFKQIVGELQYKYNFTVTGQDFDEEKGIGVIQLKGSQIAIGLMNIPIPGDELEFPSQISYLWPDAKDLTPKHKGHIIISVTSTGDSKLDLYKTFTKAAASVLTNTKAFGIYLGAQTLVLPTDFYVAGANSMTDEDLPLMNWIYFGLKDEDGKNSGYTFGLKEFGFDEMEILNSNHSKDEIHETLFNLSHYVIQSGVTLKDGEIVGLKEEQKLKLTKSKGAQLEGTTLKVEY
jgi:hypothetical protein